MKLLFRVLMLSTIFLVLFISPGLCNDNPRLITLLPGINTDGRKMLENAIMQFRYDPECTVIIREKDGLSSSQIHALIKNATQKAIARGKDVIVLIDMNLQHNIILSHLTPRLLDFLPIIGTRWFKSTRWAGNITNIVSSAFTEFGGKGRRICEAHSAGVEAVSVSIKLSKERMYDQLNLFNGRDSATELGPLLGLRGYHYSQVNVFVNIGDLPAHPHSLSNFDAVKRYAGKYWTVYLCTEKAPPMTRHSYLINNQDKPLSFEVYSGGEPYKIVASVKEIKLGSFKPKPISEDKIILPYYPEIKREERYPSMGPKDGDGGGGGVLFDTGNTYEIDKTGRIKRIAECILRSRPNKTAINWELEFDKDEYKAVALPFGKKPPPLTDVLEKRITHYYDKKQNIAVFCQKDKVVAFKFRPVGSYLEMIEIAKGDVVERKNNFLSFRISDVIYTDYPLSVSDNQINSSEKNINSNSWIVKIAEILAVIGFCFIILYLRRRSSVCLNL